MLLRSTARLRDHYDCVVVGAGPAGLNAARALLAAAKGAKLLLVDKSTPWDRPKPCAEGVGKLGFHEALPVERAWVRTSVNQAVYHAPGGRTVAYSDASGGYIIDRQRMGATWRGCSWSATHTCFWTAVCEAFRRRRADVGPLPWPMVVW
jgi:flavin-dependent dehydrogenase